MKEEEKYNHKTLPLENFSLTFSNLDLSFDSSTLKRKDTLKNKHKPNMARRPQILSYQGNIGSGKSTLLRGIQQYVNTHRNKGEFTILHEPVQLWAPFFKRYHEKQTIIWTF